MFWRFCGKILCAHGRRSGQVMAEPTCAVPPDAKWNSPGGHSRSLLRSSKPHHATCCWMLYRPPARHHPLCQCRRSLIRSCRRVMLILIILKEASTRPLVFSLQSMTMYTSLKAAQDPHILLLHSFAFFVIVCCLSSFSLRWVWQNSR